MNAYVVTRLWIGGMRSLDDVELELPTRGDVIPQRDDRDDVTALSVLIGPNGAGKSTIVEACELLRKIGTERPLIGKLYDVHGGPPALVRKHAKQLGLGVQLRSSSGVELMYVVLLRVMGMSLTVELEEATIREPGKALRSLLTRTRSHYESGWRPAQQESLSLRELVVQSRQHLEGHSWAGGKPIDLDEVALAAVARETQELADLQAALASLEIHTPIDARSSWTMASSDGGPRASNVVRPVSRVETGGRNLANVYHALRQQRDWPQTLERIRLALGEQIEDVLTPADPSGGRIGLSLRISGLGEVPAFSMSDGQLAYLALVGILRLQRPSPSALVALDEPDLHLHPSLARRLMADLETFARSTPVLVATQSDAMLDALSDPARSSVLCELDDHHATRLVRPDQEGLRRWLEDYRGLGELRAAGYEGVVFPTLETP